MKLKKCTVFFVACVAIVVSMNMSKAEAQSNYDDLLVLFSDWREFESPPLLDGAPDYTPTQFAARQDDYLALRARLEVFETDQWSIPQQVDWHIVRAEMNGYDFNRRVLQSWARDPAFYSTLWAYRSDVPGHEGPTHHALVELWTYDFPLSDAEQRRLISELRVIPPLMKQARSNLTGNARDLWVTGIRDIRAQRDALDELKTMLGDSASDELTDIIDKSSVATDELIAWLEVEADSKTGPSGIGKENYTWYQQNVHLVPLCHRWSPQILPKSMTPWRTRRSIAS